MEKYNNIDDYVQQFPPATVALLEQVRSTIRSCAPDATEKISYGIPTFYLHGNLVHFAGYKNHIGFYPGANGIATFQSELQGYKNAKGSVQFPLTEPLPLDLIARITKYRVEQQLLKKKK